jgi:hypothetical protein
MAALDTVDAVMLSVLNKPITLSVIMLYVVVLNVVAPPEVSATKGKSFIKF